MNHAKGNITKDLLFAALFNAPQKNHALNPVLICSALGRLVVMGMGYCARVFLMCVLLVNHLPKFPLPSAFF